MRGPLLFLIQPRSRARLKFQKYQIMVTRAWLKGKWDLPLRACPAGKQARCGFWRDAREGLIFDFVAIPPYSRNIALELQMTENCRRMLPIVIAPIGVSDRCIREFVVGHVIQAHHVHAIDFTHRRFIANAERAHAAVFAKVVMVLFGIKQILRKV